MRKSTMKSLGLFLGGLLGAFVVDRIDLYDVSDYQQAVADEAFYCTMAEQGAWPRTADHPCPNQADTIDTQYVGL